MAEANAEGVRVVERPRRLGRVPAAAAAGADNLDGGKRKAGLGHGDPDVVVVGRRRR